MPAAISLLVYALAVARVTRLIAEDRLTEAPRRRLAIWLWARALPDSVAFAFLAQAPREDLADVAGQSPKAILREVARRRLDDGAEPPLTVYLLTCPWCVSIYVAAVAAPLAHFWGSSPWLFVPALALAFSHLTGLLAKLGE